jgi:hypothetical protein
MGSTNLSTSGSVTATAYTSPSDARLKSNPVPLSATWTDATGTQRSLYDLAPVSFLWNRNQELDFGVIAQDVDALMLSYQQDRGDGVALTPLRVTGTDGTADVNMTVDYSKLSVLCLAMCRDLRQLVTGEGPGTGLAELVGTPYGTVPAEIGGADLWTTVRFLYMKMQDLESYIRSLASQIAPPPQPLDVGQGFGALEGEANLPLLAGSTPGLEGARLPGLSSWS